MRQFSIRWFLTLNCLSQKARQVQSSVINRIDKTLEDPNLKLGVVASDVVGVSGRAMLDAIVQGETDPAVLAQMAKGTLRNKIPQLKLALEGKITDHHRFMLRQWMDMLDFLDRKIVLLEEQIVENSRPFEATVEAWMKVPGLRRINAYSLLAEIGADMTQFPGAAQLASWAAVCPGNRESAGKQTSGRTRQGNPWLRRTLCEAAWAASRTKNSYFRAQYQRLVRTRGKNRALIAMRRLPQVSVGISGKEPSKSDTGFPECLGIRRHSQKQIKLIAPTLESYSRGKARLEQSVGAANLKGNAPLSRSFS
jgi:transposase